MARAGSPWAWLGRMKTVPSWALAFTALNLAGVLYGFFFYLPQLARTPVAYWPFVPDSPLAVLWAQLALLAYWVHRWRGRDGEAPGLAAATLDALAAVGNVQVGLWAVYVLAVYADALGTGSFSPGTFLLVAHAGMVALGLLFVHGIRVRARTHPRLQAAGIALALAFYLAQDALDYFGPDFMDRGCGLRPHIVPCDTALETLLVGVTFGLTLCVSAALLAWVLLDRAAPLAAPDADEERTGGPRPPAS